MLSNLPSALKKEVFETLTEFDAVRIERIVSQGQATPEGEWYDQGHDEWVMVVAGAADLQFKNQSAPYRLNAGDYIAIPSHCLHRVAWTDPAVTTVWLAIHSRASTTV